jgi:hypothetical protein
MENRFPEADAVTDEAFAIARGSPRGEFPELASMLHGLADMRNKQSRYSEAESLARNALEMHRRLHGAEHPETAWALFTLGVALRSQQKLTDAEVNFRESVRIFSKYYSSGDQPLDFAMNELKEVLEAKGDSSGIAALTPDNGWITRLRESAFKPKALKRLHDGTWEVDFNDTRISDLRILSGAPISVLFLGGTSVSDLASLRGMALKQLYPWRTKITDLSPLKGMPLEILNLGETKVSDLSALRGMPLTDLRLHGCTELTDLSPLADCKELKNLTLPPKAKDFEFLRAFPKLERISFAEDPKDGYRVAQTSAEFWNEYDAKKKVGARHP